jgi:hypothetical protein
MCQYLVGGFQKALFVPSQVILSTKTPPQGSNYSLLIIELRKPKDMEGGAGMSGSEDSTKKGLGGTGLDLPLNRHGNLKSASGDQSLTNILLEIKSSKTPVSTH